jgi:hypothetical protein
MATWYLLGRTDDDEKTNDDVQTHGKAAEPS